MFRSTFCGGARGRRDRISDAHPHRSNVAQPINSGYFTPRAAAAGSPAAPRSSRVVRGPARSPPGDAKSAPMPRARSDGIRFRRWRPSARRRSSAAISVGQRVFTPFGLPAPVRRPPRPLPIPSPIVLTSALKIYQSTSRCHRCAAFGDVRGGHVGQADMPHQPTMLKLCQSG